MEFLTCDGCEDEYNKYQKKLYTSFYAKVDKDLTLINQNIIKNTINDLIAKQELPATAKNLTITTPRTSCIYFLSQIHKTNHPGRPSFLPEVVPPNLFPPVFSSPYSHQ